MAQIAGMCVADGRGTLPDGLRRRESAPPVIGDSQMVERVSDGRVLSPERLLLEGERTEAE